jgi:hypothetical protein
VACEFWHEWGACRSAYSQILIWYPNDDHGHPTAELIFRETAVECTGAPTGLMLIPPKDAPSPSASESTSISSSPSSSPISPSSSSSSSSSSSPSMATLVHSRYIGSMYELERGSLYGSNGKKDVSSLRAPVLLLTGSRARCHSVPAGGGGAVSRGKTYMKPVTWATRANWRATFSEQNWLGWLTRSETG